MKRKNIFNIFFLRSNRKVAAVGQQQPLARGSEQQRLFRQVRKNKIYLWSWFLVLRKPISIFHFLSSVFLIKEKMKNLPGVLIFLQPFKLKQDFEMGLNFELGIRREQKQAGIKSPGVYNRPDLSKTIIFIFGRFYIIDFCMIFPLMLWTPPKDRFLHNRLASFTRLTKTYDTFN